MAQWLSCPIPITRYTVPEREGNSGMSLVAFALVKHLASDCVSYLYDSFCHLNNPCDMLLKIIISSLQIRKLRLNHLATCPQGQGRGRESVKRTRKPYTARKTSLEGDENCLG